MSYPLVIAAGDNFGTTTGAVNGKRPRRVPHKLQEVSHTSSQDDSDVFCDIDACDSLLSVVLHILECMTYYFSEIVSGLAISTL